MKDKHAEVRSRVQAAQEDILGFLREICAIPSMDSKIGPVGERIAAEMRKLGFDEVRFDKMGNILGRIGTGKRVIAYRHGGDRRPGRVEVGSVRGQSGRRGAVCARRL